MRITNVKVIDNLPPAEYFAMPGISYSYIRNGGVPIKQTDKILLGSAVDAFLFEPKTYDGFMFPEVSRLASRVKSFLGPSYKFARRQLSVTCIMEHNGYWMNYKGRIDLYPNFVLDLKVSRMNLLAAIKHFGYDRQLSGYAMPMKCEKSVILAINPDTYLIHTMPIPTRPDWWREQVVKYGQPI